METFTKYMEIYAQVAVVFFLIYSLVGLSMRFKDIKLSMILWVAACSAFWPIAILVPAVDFASHDHNF